MALEIVILEEKHLEDAANLVCGRYSDLRKKVPAMPSRYSEPSTVQAMLENILEAGPAVAALRGGKLVGFMAAWLLPSFRGVPSIISPELANAAGLEDDGRIYEAMYTQLAAAWVADGYTAHYVGTLANDRRGMEAWRWLGFGMMAADAIRDLSPLAKADRDTEILRAGIEHLDAIMELERALGQHLAASPTFLVEAATFDPDECRTDLENPDYVYWLALEDGEPMAYLRSGAASENASAVIYDEGTTSVTGAFTNPALRGGGIATALLDRALTWAREEGYVRCAVDFEPMNPQARRFWLRYFTHICSFSVRHVDRRAVPVNQ